MKQTQFKPQPIFVDLAKYENEKRLFESESKKRLRIAEEFKRLTATELQSYDNIIEQVYDVFKDAPDNVMNLSVSKYMDLKGISTSTLVSLLGTFENRQMPNVEDSTYFTINEDANERLKDFNTIKKAFNNYATKYNLNKALLLHITPNQSFYDHVANSVMANPQFINGAVAPQL